MKRIFGALMVLFVIFVIALFASDFDVEESLLTVLAIVGGLALVFVFLVGLAWACGG